MKSTVLRYLLFLTLLLPQAALADELGYYIRNYHVNAVVHRNNVWDITETVDLTFTSPRHGFYRNVPFQFDERINVEKDGQQKSYWLHYVSKISDVQVNDWEYEVYEEEGNTIVRIGSADRYVEGDQTYIIHYKFIYPEDRIERYTDRPWDFTNHTILPVDCNVPIDHFSFCIKYEKTLPIDFRERLKIYYGEYGEANLAGDRLEYDVRNNTIIGYMDNIPPRHTVTIYAPLEEGFFEGVMSLSPIPCVLLFGLTVLFIIAILIAEFTTKHPTITKTIEFYPPNDLCSAEVGTIIDENADVHDLASLIPWWAHKGYIEIDESKKGTQLTKVQKLPQEAPSYQRTFFNLLFANRKTVNLSSLGEYPETIKRAKDELQNIFQGERKLTTMQKSNWLFAGMLICGALTFCLSSAVERLEETTIFLGAVLWFLPAVISVFIVYFNAQRKWVRTKFKRGVIFCVRAGLMLFALCFHLGFMSYDLESFISSGMLVVLYLGAFAAIEFVPRLTVNTSYRTEMMGKLLGLKEFIETAEKPQLESLQHDDPQYFYRILPFAMVFGISDKWATLFKDIDIEQPDWYRTKSPVSSGIRASYIASAMSKSVTKRIEVISHDSSTSSGSGSSWGGGGSYSGGGGGGGGCGSW